MSVKSILKNISKFLIEFFNHNDSVVSTTMILIVIAFFSGLVLIFMNAIKHEWTVDDVMFSVFFGTFVTAGISKLVFVKDSDSRASNYNPTVPMMPIINQAVNTVSSTIEMTKSSSGSSSSRVTLNNTDDL